MKLLATLALSLAAASTSATDLTAAPPYGVDLTALLAPLWKNPNAANVVPQTVAPNLETVMNSTSITVSGIPNFAPVTFTGSKTNGNGKTSLDTWAGTSGTYKATLWRSGVGLSGDIEMGDQLVRVVRFNAQGHGAYVVWKPPSARTSLIGGELPNGDGHLDPPIGK